jgi:hypothetical protein
MRLHTQASVQPGEVLMRTTLQPIRHQKVWISSKFLVLVPGIFSYTKEGNSLVYLD